MPSSAVHNFTDPDDYAAAIRATNAEISVTGRGHFTGKIIRIDLHRLWMQRFSDNLPRVGHSANMAGRSIFSFRTEPGPSLLAGDMEMQPTAIVRHSEGQNYHRRTSGFASYGSMSLPVEEMAALGDAMAAFDLTPPRDAMLITPPLGAMTRLQRLHAAAGQLAENAPEIIAHPETAGGLEHLLIHALVECLSIGQSREDRSALRQHAMIMRRFRRAVEENPNQALYIPGTLQGDWGVGPDITVVLPGAAGDEPQAILAVATDASRAAGLTRQRYRPYNRDRDRHAIWLLAARALRRRVQVVVRGIAVGHSRSPARVERPPRSRIRHFCQK